MCVCVCVCALMEKKIRSITIPEPFVSSEHIHRIDQ